MQRPRSYGNVSGQRFARKRTASGGTRYGKPKPRRVLPDGRAASALYGHQHRHLRKAFLDQYPWCADCLTKGHHVPATELHHVRKIKERPDLRFDPANCRGLCESCHSTRTARGE